MSEALPLAIDRIRPSILQLRVDDGVSAGQAIGTGFFIHSAGYAITAKHVTEAAAHVVAQRGDGALTAGLAIPNIDGSLRISGSFEILECTVVEEDPRHDLALVKIEPNPFESGRPSGISRAPDGSIAMNGLYGLAPLAPQRPRDGVSVAVSGYPLAAPVLITTSGGIASAWAVDMVEVRPPNAPDGLTVPDMKDSYLADVAVNPGNSGGPVFLAATGDVLGVCVAFQVAETSDATGTPLRYNSGLSIVVPVNYGIDLLARHVPGLGGPSPTRTTTA